MKHIRYINEVIGLEVLNIQHYLNLLGLTFGDYTTKDRIRIRDNSYGVQIACPWVLCNNQTADILAASGDLFSLPKDLSPIQGSISQWQTKYTRLDEKLKKIHKENMLVENVEISNCGDLKIKFTNGMELHTFTDFSNDQYAWWMFKCGGAYTAPLQNKRTMKEIITSSSRWWFLKCKGKKLHFRDDDMEKEKVYEIAWDNEYKLEKSIRDTHLLGGKIIEVGREKEERLKDAPVSWIKIEILDKNEDANTCILYLYCPWRIRKKEYSEVLLATADMRAVLCWDDTHTPVLRRDDKWEGNKALREIEHLSVTRIYRTDTGNCVLELGEEYYLETFMNHSSDAVYWRKYCLGKQFYCEGGKGFFEYHGKKDVKTQTQDFYFIQQWTNELIGDKLTGIFRKGNYFAFTFKKNESQTASQLICSQTWRIKDGQTHQILIGGRDCYYPCMCLADENSENIAWNDTINTRYDELYLSIFNKGDLIINKTELFDNGDIYIYFKNGMVFEYLNCSSSCQEEWQLRRHDGEKLKAYGNIIEIVNEKDNSTETWLDAITFPEKDDVEIVKCGNINDMRNDFVMADRKCLDIQYMIGMQWFPQMMENFNMPWRLRDKEGKLLLGIMDYNIPGENTEWVDFYEKDRGSSLVEDVYEVIKDDDLRIQSVEFSVYGDVIIRLFNGYFIEGYQIRFDDSLEHRNV